jgi:putative ABC transport system permease protein
MNHLIAANLRHHPGRTLAAVAGVAVGVVLVILTTGLVRGMLRERGRRDANTGVEIMLSQRSQQGISITSLPLALPIELMDRVRGAPGTAAVAAVGQHLEMKGGSGLGLRQVDGVEFESYQRATNVRIIEGRPLPEAGEVVIVDVKYAAAHNTRIGDKLNLLDREFTVAGIYEPETGARLMIPLATMQQALGAAGKCSMFLVKCENPGEQEAVARRIVERHPEFRVIFTRDLPTLFAEGYAGLNVFLNVVAGLAAAISLLVIALTMYTTVTERTRQIGILKSLGASKRFIAAVFIRESLTISALGILGGIAVALLARAAMVYGMGTKLEIEPGSLLLVALGGLASGLLGALYPALRAASQDAVKALGHE